VQKKNIGKYHRISQNILVELALVYVIVVT